MSELETRLVAVLASSPGLSAREIAARLRRDGLAVQKRALNPLLYNDPRFQNDQGRVPRWQLVSNASASFNRTDRASQRRAARQNLDVRQDAVAALRAGSSQTSKGDALEEALELLRSRGFTVDSPSAKVEREAEPRLLTADIDAIVSAQRDRVARPRVADSNRSPTFTPVHRDSLSVPAPSLELRPWQRQALTAWYDAGGVGICEAVTGTGKTHLGLEAVAQWIRRGERATVLVPSLLLQRQWEQRIEQFVPEAVIAKVGGTRRGDAAHADVVIAVVNSAMTTDLTGLGSGMTLLVADEVHRYGGEGWSTALRLTYPYRLGLTATLERGDDGVDELLLPYFNRIVHRYTYSRAVPEHVVAPFDLVFLGVALEEDERTQYETLSRKISQARKELVAAGGSPGKLHQQLGALRSMGGRVTAAVKVYESATRERRRLLADTNAKQVALRELAEVIGESRGSVLFTQSKETATAAADVLMDCGLNAAAVYSDGMTPARRQELIDALDDGTLDALAAPKILDEGVDIPDIDLGIVLGASSSRRQMIQRLGRVIRLKADNRRARFVIMYALDSIEDPETGGRDEFMDEVEDAAASVVLFREWDDTTIDDIWSGLAPTWDRDAPTPLAAAEPTTLTDLIPVRDAPVRRVSRPLPPPRRPHRPDPTVAADLLQRIDATIALAEWVRAERVDAGSR